MSLERHTIRVECLSHYKMVDVVEALSNHLALTSGADDDSKQQIGLALREGMVNAIKHGNKEDTTKNVIVEFTLEPLENPTTLSIRIVDQGAGFDPDEVADPLASDNVLKTSGRGLLFMRSFMDEVSLQRIPDGGMEVRLVKKLNPSK